MADCIFSQWQDDTKMSSLSAWETYNLTYTKSQDDGVGILHVLKVVFVRGEDLSL